MSNRSSNLILCWSDLTEINQWLPKDTPTDRLTEYWELNRLAGADDPTVSLYWNNLSYCRANYIKSGNETDLRVVGWSGVTDWNHLGAVTTLLGPNADGTEGSITTINPVVSIYPRHFTLGSVVAENMLPIRLQSFIVMPGINGADLTWQTDSELNNNYFTIERMENSQFVTLKNVQGAGTTNLPKKYQWTDISPLPGRSYYRLRQTDFDGNETLSEVVAFEWKSENTPYPNPVSDVLCLNSLNFDEDSSLIIIDATGRAVYSGAATQSLNFKDFHPGIYHLGVKSRSGVRWYSIHKQ